jgi:hypothetical protein
MTTQGDLCYAAFAAPGNDGRKFGEKASAGAGEEHWSLSPEPAVVIFFLMLPCESFSAGSLANVLHFDRHPILRCQPWCSF